MPNLPDIGNFWGFLATSVVAVAWLGSVIVQSRRNGRDIQMAIMQHEMECTKMDEVRQDIADFKRELGGKLDAHISFHLERGDG